MKNHTERPRWLTALGWAVVAFLVVALCYVGYQVVHVVNPPNSYETILMATVEDTVEAEGVLLFTETTVAGSGNIGYLVEDGERVSAGTVVAEVYTSPEQSTLRAELTDLQEQIRLLERAENVSTTQLDSLTKARSTALYDMLDAVDRGALSALEDGREDYLLAQNKILVVTGEAADFSTQIAALEAEAAQLQSRLGAPAQITAPLTGYFIRSGSTRRLARSAEEILALDAAGLKSFLDEGAEAGAADGAGKLVSGFSWQYCGVCPAEQGAKLLNAEGKPLTGSVKIRFPGQTESTLKAYVTEVTTDEASGLTRFVLRCDSITADVLRLGQADAEIIVGETSGLRVPAAAVHYVPESGGAASAASGGDAAQAGENYVPGVYVKFGNLARFCKIDPVDSEHPLVTDGDYIIVSPKGTSGSVSELRLYDEVIVKGQNLYDGKLLS